MFNLVSISLIAAFFLSLVCVFVCLFSLGIIIYARNLLFFLYGLLNSSINMFFFLKLFHCSVEILNGP